MDINTDLNCSGNTHAAMNLSGRSGWDITMAPVAAQGTHISMAQVAACSSDTNMVSGD